MISPEFSPKPPQGGIFLPELRGADVRYLTNLVETFDDEVDASRQAQTELNQLVPLSSAAEDHRLMKDYVGSRMVRRAQESLAVNRMLPHPEQKLARIHLLNLLWGEDRNLMYPADRQAAREWMDKVNAVEYLKSQGIDVRPRRLGLKALQASQKLHHHVRLAARLKEVAGKEGDLTSAVARHAFRLQQSVLGHCAQEGLEEIKLGGQTFVPYKTRYGFSYLRYFNQDDNSWVHFYDGHLLEESGGCQRNAGTSDGLFFLTCVLNEVTGQRYV